MRLVILGAPGSGKRTQASLLAKKYGLTTLTSTELVKAAMSEESEQGLQLRLLQEAGQAVTEDIILSLLQARLRLPDVQGGFILDGFPRNLLQSLTLDEMLAEIGQPIDFVLLIHMETDTLMERLVGRRTCRACGAAYNIYTHPSVVEDVCDACGGRLHRRYDDNEETVSNRLHVFDHLTSQVLSHYGKLEKVLRVDGDGEADEVFARVCEAIDIAVSQRKVEPVPPVPPEVPAAEQPVTPETAPEKKATTKQPVRVAPGKKKKQAPAKQTATQQSVVSPDSAASSKKGTVGKQLKKGTVKPSKGQATKKVVSKVTAKSAGGRTTGRQNQGASTTSASTKRSSSKKVEKQTVVTSAKKPAARQVAKKTAGAKLVDKAKSSVKKAASKQAAPGKAKIKPAVGKKVIVKSLPKQASAKKKSVKKSPAKPTAAIKSSSAKPKSAKPSAAGLKNRQAVAKQKIAKTGKKQAAAAKASQKVAGKATLKTLKKSAKPDTKKIAKKTAKKTAKKVAKKTTSRRRR